MEDRRKRYTKMVLKESLLRLLEQKPLHKITVTELCKEADINRATYYAHYENVYDQIEKMEQEVLEEVAGTLTDSTRFSKDPTLRGQTAEILRYLHANRVMIVALLRMPGYVERYSNAIREYVEQASEYLSTEDPITQDSIYVFATEGTVGAIRQWLSNENDPRTPEEMADLIVTLCRGATMIPTK